MKGHAQPTLRIVPSLPFPTHHWPSNKKHSSIYLPCPTLRAPTWPKTPHPHGCTLWITQSDIRPLQILLLHDGIRWPPTIWKNQKACWIRPDPHPIPVRHPHLHENPQGGTLKTWKERLLQSVLPLGTHQEGLQILPMPSLFSLPTPPWWRPMPRKSLTLQKGKLHCQTRITISSSPPSPTSTNHSQSSISTQTTLSPKQQIIFFIQIFI